MSASGHFAGLIAVLVASVSSMALADEAKTSDVKRSTITLLGGTAQFSGDLSKEKNVPTFGIAVRAYSPKENRSDWMNSVSEALGGVNSGLLVNSTFGSTKNSGRDFPFEADAEVNFFSLDLSADVCFMAKHSVHPCLDIGFGQLEVGQAKNRQNYGIIPMGAKIEYIHASGFTINAQYAYRNVQQRVDDHASSFAIASETIGIGWTY